MSLAYPAGGSHFNMLCILQQGLDVCLSQGLVIGNGALDPADAREER